MAKFSAVVSAYKNKQGTRNVMIYIYQGGKRKYVQTNFYLAQGDLTRTRRIKNQVYKDQLEDILRRCRQRCNEFADKLGAMSVNEITKLVYNIIVGKSDNGFQLDFIDFANKHISKLEDENRIISASSYKSAINNLIKFIGERHFNINDLSSQLIKEWIDNIEGIRAKSLYPALVKYLYNLAKFEYNDEEKGMIRIAPSLFNHVDIPKQNRSEKRALNRDVINKIIGANGFARDVFILSFGLIGMNAKDLFDCEKSCFDGKDTITYCRAKTKNRRCDDAVITVKIEPEIMPIFEKFLDKDGTRLFNFYKEFRSVEHLRRKVNSELKTIGKKLNISYFTYYAARHSWATIARNDARVDKYLVHEALNHSDREMKVTDIYIKKDFSLIWSANRRVFDLLEW